MIRPPGESNISLLVKETYPENWTRGILAGVILIAFIFCYAGVFASLAGQWWNNDMYSYGFLIPWISLYLIWIRRETLSRISPLPNYTGGVPFFITGMGMLLLGQAGGIITLQEISLMFTIPGLVLLLLGTRFLKALWLPIGYLLFMMPIWDFLTDRLHFPFQLFSATLGVRLLQVLGIPVFQQGQYIQLPNITLEVARACSGVNYLISVVAIGIPLAYLFLNGVFRRILLVVYGVVVAVLSNSLRVALIGFLSYYGIGGDLHGPFHMLQGMFVSVIGFGALFAGVMVLSQKPRQSPPSIPAGVSDTIQKIHHDQAPQSRSREILYVGLFLSAILILGGCYYFFHKPLVLSLKGGFKDFPAEMGSWKRVPGKPEPPIYWQKGVDEELSAVYGRNSNKNVQFYIGYFSFQNQEKKLVNFKTDELHRLASKIKIHLNSDDVIEVNQVIQNEGKMKKMTFFWYDLNGRIVTDQIKAKAYMLSNAVLERGTNGAVIMLTMDYKKPEDESLYKAEAGDFIKNVVPALRNYLPLKNVFKEYAPGG
jgi:EpsI family protein